MQKPKLDIDELFVSSFATSSEPAATSDTVDSIIINPNDPTAATWCYICPMRTEDCY
jgi:hypothetical protein